MSVKLLPQNAAPVTPAYAEIWDSYGRYGDLIGQIKFIGLTITPDDWVPWFIWDFGLEDAVPYVRDHRRVLAEGPEWQRTRGTPRGIQIGLGWVESSGEVAASDQRHDWWEFQVGFDLPASDLDQIAQLEGIIKLSKASEDELFRMFSTGRDHRPVRMDMHRYDDGLYDGYSGERLNDIDAIVSFGWLDAAEIIADPQPIYAEVEIEAGEIDLIEGYRYDRDAYSERPPILAEIAETWVDAVSLGPEHRAAWPSAYARGSWAKRGAMEVIPTPVEFS